MGNNNATTKHFGGSLLDYAFIISVVIKGIDGLLESLGGLILLFFKIETLTKFAEFVTAHELAHDPNDLIANFLLNAAQDLSVSFKIFVASYLLLHGLVKVFLVVSLLRDKLWAYPFAIIFLVLFVFYQVGMYVHAPSVIILLLTIFDVFVTILVWKEYKKQLLKNETAN